jgi:hypothetical protein
MDSGKYRKIMTDLFFHGEVPPDEPEEKGPRPKKGTKTVKRAPRPPKMSKLDELRAFNQAIAARNAPAE